jgi:hypothetical protein
VDWKNAHTRAIEADKMVDLENLDRKERKYQNL